MDIKYSSGSPTNFQDSFVGHAKFFQLNTTIIDIKQDQRKFSTITFAER